jgi:integrase
MQTELPFLSREIDRHGNSRIYVRRSGKRIRIRERENTPDFAKAYTEAVEKLGEPRSKRKAEALPTHPQGSLGWLGAQYFASKAFGGLVKHSRGARRGVLEACFRVPLSDAESEVLGNCPLKHLTAKKIKRMIEAASGPGAADNRRKFLSMMCSWAVDAGHLTANPVRDVRMAKGKTAGYYTWTVSDVEQFLAYHKEGSKARLALALLLFTGARRQDAVTFGRQHIRGDWLVYVPRKTVRLRPKPSQKPLLPALKQIIVTSKTGALTFLETAQGKPFTSGGFGNWFRRRCDEAGLPQCTAHGLKKAGATIAAENGATTMQLMAMFDWTKVSTAEPYTREADRKRLAGAAMGLISLDRSANENCRTADPVVSHREFSGGKSSV